MEIKGRGGGTEKGNRCVLVLLLIISTTMFSEKMIAKLRWLHLNEVIEGFKMRCSTKVLVIRMGEQVCLRTDYFNG